MPTNNPRINVTFEESVAGSLSDMARREHKPVATLVRELTLEALARREDFHLSELADRIDKGNLKTYSHADAWA